MFRCLSRLLSALRSPFVGRRAERELDAEMRGHLEEEIDARIRAGASPAEARRAALLEMGGVERSKEECRDIRKGGAGRFAATVFQDLRFALRLFRRHPAPVTIAVCGLALAIGAVTSIFTIVNATLLRPYRMDHPETVVKVAHAGEPSWVGLSYQLFLQMHAATSLATIEASREAPVRLAVTPGSNDEPYRWALFVSGGYLSMLGGRPALGRTLIPTDDTPGAPVVAVVSHRFWMTSHNADLAAIGKSIWINTAPVQVVGVMRPDFTGPMGSPPSVWLTIASYDDVLAGPAFTETGRGSVEVVGRLQPGATALALGENLTTVANQTDARRQRREGPPPSPLFAYHSASPASEPRAFGGDTVPGLIAGFGLVGLVLALACANTANLLMAAAVTRVREVGVRLAMGATRGRLVRQLITESVLLGLIAGGVSLLVTFWTAPVIGRMVEVSPEMSLAPDAGVWLFNFIVALICGVGTGLSPARFGARGNLQYALKTDAGPAGRVRARWRVSFIGFQAAASMLLIAGAGLFARAAIAVAHVEIGYDVDRIVTIGLRADGHVVDTTYLSSALEAVVRVPSIERVSLSQYEPFGFSAEDDVAVRNGRRYDVQTQRVDADYFVTMGLRVLRGRAFTADEARSGAPVALVSESMARDFFDGGDPIGQSTVAVIPPAEAAPGTSRVDSRAPATIIGVVGDALLRLPRGEQSGTIYRPLGPPGDNPPALIVRTATPGLAARAAEDALRRIDARVVLYTRNLRDELDEDLQSQQRIAWLVGPVAVLALVLALVGLYGVTAFVVSQRMKEVGVRMAIGASSARVLQMLVKDSLRPVLIGLAVGAGLALAGGQLLAEALPGISPHDPTAIGGAFLTLLVCASAAVIVPARRAAKTNPAKLLRQ